MEGNEPLETDHAQRVHLHTHLAMICTEHTRYVVPFLFPVPLAIFRTVSHPVTFRSSDIQRNLKPPPYVLLEL